MSSMPSATGFDSTLALLRNPYGFIRQTCRHLDADLFETRILLHKTICMTGAAAAEAFYREEQLIREGSMPSRIQKTLLGEGGVQGLDDATHQHRKKMFMSMMGTEHIAALQGMSLHMLDNFAPDWEARNEVVFYDEVREMLTRAVCAWCGVPIPEAEVATRTAQLTSLFQDAGAIGPKHWAARLARRRADRLRQSPAPVANLARAMAGALADAGINASDVGYVNAHGTGTAANDKTECAAVADVFGAHADKLMISSTKSMHGHLIGGTGAVELLACIMAVRDGVIAPTIGYEEPDPECALDVVPNEAREAVGHAAETFDVEPGRLEQVEERLFSLRAAARKYGVGIAELVAKRAEFSKELENKSGNQV